MYCQMNIPMGEGSRFMPEMTITHLTRKMTATDHLGALQVRLGFGRDRYQVVPGVYALGDPDRHSPVLVTANYKLTIDVLRSSVGLLDAWVLVLDTRGINVWCAAGKGTFGTAELVKRVQLSSLMHLVDHRTLILPQLGAPGISAHQVKRETGFSVVYGPVRANDIPAFLENHCQATKDMRRVTFTLKERLMVVPVEIHYSVKLLPVLFILFMVFHLSPPGDASLSSAVILAGYNLAPHAGAFLLGTVGVAALLPWLPGRSFAVKGLVMGLIWTVVIVRFHAFFQIPDSRLLLGAHGLLATAITSFFALNFTGSTTYTSLSGVQKETVISLPIMAAALLAGLGMMAAYRINLLLGS